MTRDKKVIVKKISVRGNDQYFLILFGLKSRYWSIQWVKIEYTLLCLILGVGSNKMHLRGNYQGLLKLEGGGGWVGHSLLIIKWTWGFFSQNLQFDHPLQLGTKECKDAHMTSGTSYERHTCVRFKSCVHRVKLRPIHQSMNSFAENQQWRNLNNLKIFTCLLCVIHGKTDRNKKCFTFWNDS